MFAAGGDKVYAHQMVRTDSRDQKLDAFLSKPKASVTTVSTSLASGVTASPSGIRSNQQSSISSVEKEHPGGSAKSATHRREIKLSSILSLQQDIENNAHTGLRELFQDHTFVGCVSEELALVQHQTKLYLVNTHRLSKHLFYQLIMYDFGNFGVLRLSEPAPVYDLAMLALDSEDSGWTPADGPKEELAKYVTDFLMTHVDMLSDYFAMQVDKEGNLLTLPMLLDKYIPPLAGLPMFILRLATEVTWDSEKECFKTFAKELSDFYAVKKNLYAEVTAKDTQQGQGQGEGSSQGEAKQEKGDKWQWAVEHVIYPAFRSLLMPPKSASEDTSVLQLANLPDLYKVFERC
ncbi:hypothetical protein V1264_013814 [Littorina saxatilis]|uniref:DNA mismatch repair protein Mlh1 C-terminal domain-containing protein n=1 Tax=Littorina saxatilis TaxID=31220 RepID=A0AAN9BRF6_9CAEN